MFKKFSSESISSNTQVKSSVAKGIRNTIVDLYPGIEPYIEELIPKKAAVYLVKCQDFITAVMVDNQLLFVNHENGPWLPSLRVLHKYPDMMKTLQVDKGAIKFVIAGANIMCPGLTSPGALIKEDLPKDTPVAIYAEGKEHALAIGITTMSTDDIKSINKGVGVELMQYLGDGLWQYTTPSQ